MQPCEPYPDRGPNLNHGHNIFLNPNPYLNLNPQVVLDFAPNPNDDPIATPGISIVNNYNRT